MISFFEALLGYYPQMSYKDNRDPQFKLRSVDKNAATLRDLMKELKVNLAKSQELQTLYHNKHVKKRSYRPGKSFLLSAKHIKTKQNPKLEHNYFGPFQIVETVGNQAYRLKLLAKWRIYLVFHVLFLEKDVIRRKAVDQKIANQLKFEEEKQLEQEIDLILDNMVFAKKVVNGRPSELYYLFH